MPLLFLQDHLRQLDVRLLGIRCSLRQQHPPDFIFPTSPILKVEFAGLRDMSNQILLYLPRRFAKDTRHTTGLVSTPAAPPPTNSGAFPAESTCMCL